MKSFCPHEGHDQSKSHYAKFLSFILMQKLQVQIVIQNPRLRLIDEFFEDKENDTKEV